MILRTLLVLGCLLAFSGAYGAYLAIEALRPVSQDEAEAELFLIEQGQGLNQVARKLEQAGLVRDARVVSLFARYRGDDRRLQVGEYEVSASWSTATILDRLTSGRVKTYELVIPEGTRATEIGEKLEAAGLVTAEEFALVVADAEFAKSLGIEQAGLEGYLYPETYRIPRRLGAKAIAKIFVEQFDRVWKQLEPAAKQQSLSRNEIVTLASIVEKETAAPDERPLIAAVFHNRLEKRMRLETDPTVIYGIKNYDGNIRRRDLRDDSNPYNTYRIFGLPPGPIASPGIDALRAVLEPAESDFLYFVSRNDGTHKFSKTYREHKEAVREFQLRRRSRK